jgi:hypothetical protein
MGEGLPPFFLLVLGRLHRLPACHKSAEGISSLYNHLHPLIFFNLPVSWDLKFDA